MVYKKKISLAKFFVCFVFRTNKFLIKSELPYINGEKKNKYDTLETKKGILTN